MRTLWRAGLSIALAFTTSCGAGTERAQQRDADEATFSAPTQINNPYLPLAKFGECVLEGEEEGASLRIVRTPLDRTERFEWRGNTIEAIVIRDREYEDGELIEDTRDYFAQSDDGTVYYLGEDVDNYKNGELTDHEGAWRLGRDTDNPGVVMPADPEKGTEFRPEDVPDITVEDAVVDEVGLRLEVGERTYSNVIKIREIHPEDVEEFKFYARDTGLVREQPSDGRIDLVSCNEKGGE